MQQQDEQHSDQPSPEPVPGNEAIDNTLAKIQEESDNTPTSSKKS